MELKNLIDQPGHLPTIPKVAQRLIASFSDEDVSISEISEQLAADPGLSAHLLKLANSAYFHVSRSIDTVEAALQMLGFVMVRNLVLGTGVASAFKQIPGIDLQQFWRYNLYTACTARWLAHREDANSDLVFTLGLMHGIGQLQMHAVMARDVAPLNCQMSVLDAARAQLELDTFGFHYGDVSAELALAWNFPLSLTDALRHVAQPLAAPNFSEAAAWVHMGTWRARCDVLGLPVATQAASYPDKVAQRLHLEPGWAQALFAPGQPEDAERIMPPLPELTHGLEAMFD